MTTLPESTLKRSVKNDVATRIFVLDTCVLLHDHTCLHQFEEHRIALPLTVLEELDTFKVGTETKNFEARQTVRILDELSRDHDVKSWIPIEEGAPGKIRVVMSPADGPAIDRRHKQARPSFHYRDKAYRRPASRRAASRPATAQRD